MNDLFGSFCPPCFVFEFLMHSWLNSIKEHKINTLFLPFALDFCQLNIFPWSECRADSHLVSFSPAEGDALTSQVYASLTHINPIIYGSITFNK